MRDYIYFTPPRLFSTVPALPSTPPPIETGEAVTYRSFDGRDYSLREFRGKNVSILLPPAWVAGLGVANRRLLLDRTDLFYEYFKELIGAEPAGSGPLRIAFVPNTCGWGCGYIGAKGVEILDADWALADVNTMLSLQDVPSVVTHEMTHNFDVYWPYTHYLSEHAHAWTAFIDTYIQVYARQGYSWAAPDDLLSDSVESRWMPYIKDPAANWQTTVRDGMADIALRTWGGMHLRFAQLHGPAAVRKAMRHWKAAAESGRVPATPEEKEDLDIEGLAAGAGLNLGCYVDAWRWYASAAARARMLAAYGVQNPLCRDGKVGSEFDEIHGTIVNEAGDFPGHPNAFPVPFPVHINATAGALDDDYFEFTLPSAGLVNITVRPSPEFQGYLFVHAADRLAWMASALIEKGTPASVTLNYPSAGQWTFEIYQTPPLAAPAAYSVEVTPRLQWPPHPWGNLLAINTAGQTVHVTFNVGDLRSEVRPPTEIRFWLSGYGFVETVPFQPSVSFDWTLPPDARGLLAFLAQPFADGIPVADSSPISWFQLDPAAVCASDITSQFTVSPSGFRMNNSSRHFLQTVTVTRTRSDVPLTGPFALVLDGLSQTAGLFNADGATSCGAVTGSPYVYLGTGNSWALGQSVTALLEFASPTNQAIRYTPRVIGGGAKR